MNETVRDILIMVAVVIIVTGALMAGFGITDIIVRLR